MSKANYNPPSLNGKPSCNLTQPGHCQLTADFQSLKLLERVKVSPTSSVLRFELADTSKPLNLSTCACLLANAKMMTNDGEEEVTRPYTPISTNELKGCFDLLVKDYGPESKMSNHLCTNMKVGDAIQFKHIEFNVKIQAPFIKPKTVVMLVGGTGVTPMIQALHAILGDPNQSHQNVVILYGSKNSEDILAKDLLDLWAKDHATQLQVHHILSHEPEQSEWDGSRGYIDKDRLQQYVPDAAVGDDVLIFVCGPPPMYDALCGPRTEQEAVKGLLGEMGYTPKQVYKF